LTIDLRKHAVLRAFLFQIHGLIAANQLAPTDLLDFDHISADFTSVNLSNLLDVCHGSISFLFAMSHLDTINRGKQWGKDCIFQRKRLYLELDLVCGMRPGQDVRSRAARLGGTKHSR
jgi:hypothetical protein